MPRTIDISFQSHFISHLTRPNASDHSNPYPSPATTLQDTNMDYDIMLRVMHLVRHHDVAFDICGLYDIKELFAELDKTTASMVCNKNSMKEFLD
jgi:hypothetical protein